MATRIRPAAIPAGGLGSRLLPWTRAVPKELLPVWKRLVHDYALEEAVAAGIERVVIVTAPSKEALQATIAVSQLGKARHATRPGTRPDAAQGAPAA
jgi:UTP--glucose-1-phosphate uridylyltransferase